MMTWLFAGALALSTVAPVPAVLTEPPVPQPEQVMSVPPELRAELQRWVIGSGGSHTLRLQRLVDFMFQDSGLGMKYAADPTLTVAQAYRARRANCLTFTLMTVALAREVGLQAYGQEIEDALAWREKGSLVYRTNHVNAGIRIGARRFSVDVAENSILAPNPPKPVSDQRLLALYYNNRVAEMLASAAVPQVAARYMALSLRLDPGYANSWNNAGVLHLHQGDHQAAERDYLKALELDSRNASALFNLALLYDNDGDQMRSASFKQRLQKVQLKDPYYQLLQAMDAAEQGDYGLAVKRYKRAIRLHRSEPRFYLGLAHAYQELGDEGRARRALSRARALSLDGASGQEHVRPGGLRG